MSNHSNKLVTSRQVTQWTIVTVYKHSVHVRCLAVLVFFSLEGADHSDKPGRWPPLSEKNKL